MDINKMTKEELKDALTKARIDVYRQTSIKKLREDYAKYLQSQKTDE